MPESQTGAATSSASALPQQARGGLHVCGAVEAYRRAAP